MWNLNLNIVKASHCTWVSFFSLNQSFVKNNFKNLDNFINLHIAVFLFSALLFKWKEMGHYWLHDLGKNPTANLKRCNYFYFPSNIKWRDMKKSCISSFTREVFVIRQKKKKNDNPVEGYITPLGDSSKMGAETTPSGNGHWGLKKRGELRIQSHKNNSGKARTWTRYKLTLLFWTLLPTPHLHLHPI